MDKNEAERLKFRNQYILTSQNIKCPSSFIITEITGNYRLYSHIDLLLEKYVYLDTTLVLLGDIFDYRNPGKSNSDILQDLVHHDFTSLLHELDQYTGRFVLIYKKGRHFVILHDATSSRKIYYTNHKNTVSVTSRPYLLASLLHIEKTKNQQLLRYYRSDEFHRLNNSNIGDFTIYDEIKQLLPNHFLEINTFNVVRYWPYKEIEYRSVKEIGKNCALMITGFMSSILNRYSAMLPVTAGKDSRILLAATKEYSNKVYYYINHEDRLSIKSPDIKVPQKLLSKLNLKLNILYPQKDIDTDFREIYFQNNEYASSGYLPLIYNYYQNFKDRINLPGNIASAGFEIYKNRKLKISGRNLAKLNHLSEFDIAVNYYDKWISQCRDTCTKYNINVLNLFYWEERLANWGTQIQMEKDIAQEDINPFNSRKFVELYLSVHPKYISYPFFKLQKTIIKNLWPDVLSMPINPGIRTTFFKLATAVGFIDVYYFFKNAWTNK